jgi:hypothetical protein
MPCLSLLLISLTSAAAPASAAAPQPGWVELSAANVEHGLTVPDAGDGRNAAATLGGVACRQTAEGRVSYLYVKAEGAPAGLHDAYVTIDYWDADPAFFPVEYDADRPYTAAEDGLVRFGTRTWRRAVVRLPNARFDHGQNQGADFRLCGGSLAVRRIALSFEPPADYAPGGVRVPENLPRRAGAGMEVVFGSLEASFAQAALARAQGASSYETYVTWRSVENAGEGRWDWSRWDRQVEILRRAGLKWVPILIAGPAYATPDWFRASSESAPYVCLEHGEASQIQSLWNPALRGRIDRFIQAFAQHFGGDRAIESVMLGVSGSFGETLYPAGPATGWIYDIPGPFHNHFGYWAGDRFAAADFRRAMRQRYGAVDALNRAWRTELASFDQVVPFLPEKAPSLRARLDFMTWYTDSMTAWAAFCTAAARRHLPDAELYLCVGGFGEPELGADFTALARAIAPYHAGVRITNEGSDYRFNWAITSEMATACAALGEPLGIEPGGAVTDAGNVARIFNASASGARALFCYTFNVEIDGKESRGFAGALPWLKSHRPRVPVGFFLPKTTWRLEPDAHPLPPVAAMLLRDRTNAVLVDAALLAASPPVDLRVLALADAPYAERDEVAALRHWVEGGGLLVALADPDRPLLRTPEGADAGAAGLLASPPAGARPLRASVPGAPPRRFRLAIGKAPDDDFLFGDWNGREPGGLFPRIPGATQRWTGARSGLLVPCAASSDAWLTVDAHLDPHTVAGDNRVLVNGTPVGVLDRVGSNQYRFAVSRALLGASGVAEVTFAVRTFRPSDDGSGDTRVLGAAVASVELAAVGAEAQAPTTPVLDWDLDWAEAAACTRRIGRGATLVLPGRHAAGLAQAVARLLAHPERMVPGLQPIPAPAQAAGVYAAGLTDGVLFYNAGSEEQGVDGLDIPPSGIAWQPDRP